MTTLKTAALMALLSALFVLVGYLVGGQGGIVIALGFALISNLAMYWFSDRIAIAMSGGQAVSPAEAPDLHAIVDELVARTGMPKPKVYLIDTMHPNAFATGRSPHHASVAVTRGILQLLTPRELRAVLAHELGHVANRDILVATIAAVFAGAIAMIANIAQWSLFFGGHDDEEHANPLALVGTLLAIIVAPIAATIVQLAISRSREHGADEYGARLSGDPLALASALQKIEAGVHMIPHETNPAVATLYIQNPLHGGMIASLFSTHPRTIDRVNRLRRMAGLPILAT